MNKHGKEKHWSDIPPDLEEILKDLTFKTMKGGPRCFVFRTGREKKDKR